MSDQFPQPAVTAVPTGASVAIVAARFNADLVDELLRGCLDRLRELGCCGDFAPVHRVPGAFELPLAAKALCRTGRCAAVIALGAVVRGQTPHFEYVSGQCAAGLAEVGLEEMIPVIFGVLTCDTRQQALDRIGGPHGHAGVSAANAAAEMIHLMRRLA